MVKLLEIENENLRVRLEMQSLDNFLNKEISPVSGSLTWTGALDHEDQSPSLKHTTSCGLEILNGYGHTWVRGSRINTEDGNNKPDDENVRNLWDRFVTRRKRFHD